MALFGAFVTVPLPRNDRQVVFILREQGCHSGIAMDRNDSTRCIGRPVEEGPAWIRCGGQGDDISIMVRGLIGGFCNRAVTGDIDRECVFIQRCGDGEVGGVVGDVVVGEHTSRAERGGDRIRTNGLACGAAVGGRYIIRRQEAGEGAGQGRFRLA